MTQPIVENHNGVLVVRDDLFEGGTKARFIPLLFFGTDEVVYASPAEGGAQTALATVASQLSKRATIFVAKRARPHPRTLMAKRLGAQIVPVSPGYLNVVQARAIKYSHQLARFWRRLASTYREPYKRLLRPHSPSGFSPSKCGVRLVRVSWRAV